MSSFQKVATFKIVGGNKQGGNVAAYFCAPDGRVLHCVAGPVDAATFLREVEVGRRDRQDRIKDSKGDGAKFKEHVPQGPRREAEDRSSASWSRR